jgi:hypothetical protein
MSAHVEDRLSAYLDGELTVADAARVRQHLALCPPCAARHDALRSVDRAFRDLLVEAPPGYFDTFSTRVRDRIAASRRPSRFRFPVWSLAAAAALLLAVLLPRLPWDKARSPEPLAMAPMSPPSAAAPPSTAPAPVVQVRVPKRESEADEAGKRADAAVRSREAPSFAAPPSERRLQDSVEARAEAPALSVDLQRPRSTKASGVVGEAAEGAAPAPPVVADAYGREAQDDVTARMTQGVAKPAPEPAPAAPSARRPALTTEAWAAKEAPSLGVTAAGGPPLGEDEAYDALQQQEALIPGRVSIEKLRSLRTAWRAFLASHPTSPRVDDARVRVVALGVDIARRSGERRDAEEARRDGRDYLGRGDAAQKERVSALLAGLAR